MANCSGELMFGKLHLVTADEEFALRLEAHLRGCEIDCKVIDTNSASVELAESPKFDAMLIDLDAMPNPLRQLQSIRSAAGQRVLLVCAKKDVGVDVVLAYEAGADDYFAKFTDLVVVEAKVRRAIRRSLHRSESSESPNFGRSGEARLCSSLRDVEPALTRFEHRLLQLLSDEPGRLVSQVTILQQLWGRNSANPKLLYEHISTLRCKLLPWGWTIANVRGKGYRLELRSTECPSPDGMSRDVSPSW